MIWNILSGITKRLYHNILCRSPRMGKEIRPEDSVSQTSRHTGSSVASQKRLAEAQRLAELSACASAMKQQHELQLNRHRILQRARELEKKVAGERQRIDDELQRTMLNLQIQEEEMKVDTELRISFAKLETLDKLESGDHTSAREGLRMTYSQIQGKGPQDLFIILHLLSMARMSLKIQRGNGVLPYTIMSRRTQKTLHGMQDRCLCLVDRLDGKGHHMNIQESTCSSSHS